MIMHDANISKKNLKCKSSSPHYIMMKQSFGTCIRYHKEHSITNFFKHHSGFNEKFGSRRDKIKKEGNTLHPFIKTDEDSRLSTQVGYRLSLIVSEKKINLIGQNL